MKTTNSNRYKQRMLVGIRSKIRHYERCLKKLANLDADVLAAGIELFDDGETFAVWLCEPQVALGGKSPLSMMSTASGCQQVRRILNAIKHGVYL